MSRKPLLLVPVAFLALASSLSAQKEVSGQKDVAMAQEFNFSVSEAKKETDAVAEIDKKIATTTDLKEGCGLLAEKLDHLGKADALLDRMIYAAKELKRRKETESAEKQQKSVRQSIEITKGDDDRLCSALRAG
ncbi:hypothetical protein SZ64_10810 [Erythrobacter sp. SG61-1L]|uniref:hypothetical protein n=1 Tax=Erythrobacter sp. SG61-1L TaxID=1603897 RepID=UPI0006C92FD2|nr:hypothetical protein [Erythrobacter sp. SG61-1L]KPL68553.1 hypothetical protein SZ64_10810 [Erythrobacter sp. SG61-1L]